MHNDASKRAFRMKKYQCIGFRINVARGDSIGSVQRSAAAVAGSDVSRRLYSVNLLNFPLLVFFEDELGSFKRLLAFEKLLTRRRSGGAGSFRFGGGQTRLLRAREVAENEARLGGEEMLREFGFGKRKR